MKNYIRKDFFLAMDIENVKKIYLVPHTPVLFLLRVRKLEFSCLSSKGSVQYVQVLLKRFCIL